MARLSRALKTREAHNAQQLVQDRLKAGTMTKPESCSSCGKHTDDLEFAHANYSQGKANGRWLCHTCHSKWDTKSPKGGGSGSAGTERAP